MGMRGHLGFLNGPFPAIFTDDWNQTKDLWCRKQLLYQLSHNHCPITPRLINWQLVQLAVPNEQVCILCAKDFKLT